MRIVVLLGFGVAAVLLAVVALLGWTTMSIDRQSEARQQKIARNVANDFRNRISHEQESATVWDDAVEHVRAMAKTKDAEWVDANLGAWMHNYFGHDAAFVLGSSDELLFASEHGEVVGFSRYDLVRSIVAPLATQLRAKLRSGDTRELSDRILTQATSDFGYFDGHPAIFSVKPIVSDSGEIEQVPGEEALHVAVRVLDGELLTELARKFDFDDLHFSSEQPDPARYSSLSFARANGAIIGYIGWAPYRPGLIFLRSITPGLLIVLALVIGATTMFSVLLQRRLRVNREQEDLIRHLANHDGLTGLLNRVAFERELDTALSEADRRGSQVAIIYLDLDRFKQVNDSLGHSAGDALIREVAERVEALLPADGRLCRNGGDEFNIFVPFTAMTTIEAICDNILSAIGEPFILEGQAAFVGVSVGVATFPTHGQDRSELVRKADVALYNAKASGRGRYAIFGPHMDVLVRERADIERELRVALEDPRQFSVVYQPKYVARTGKVGSVEALIRWQHPTRGLLAPSFFIPIAEESGLIKSLGRHVMREAFAAAVKWPISSIAVNVSPVQWRDPRFALEVVTLLGETGLSARRVELEVTETAWTDHCEYCQANIKALRDIGIRIALDDFGTGFSSFGRLHETEVDHVKIDRMFVEGIGKSTGDEAIVKAIVDLARAHGLHTTAEGVQTEEQRKFLQDIGCDELQGFLLSKPLPTGEMDALFNLTRLGEPVALRHR